MAASISPRKKLIISGILLFILGVLLASAFWYYHNQKKLKDLSSQIIPLRQNNNPYQYINPLLGYNVPSDVKEFNEYKLLEQKISGNLKNVGLDDYSVYFRDLTLGRWTGINENSNFSPGSMMKVAIMVAYFKQAENDPGILQQQFLYSSSTVDEVSGVPFSAPSNLQVGKSYTVENLIEAMIINSDNGAKDVLINHIDQRSFVEVHTDLGLPNPADGGDYKITAKEYAILLRVLYNATYLSRADSEKALQILSQAQYDPGLVAGVPTGTGIAQKYGEAIEGQNSLNPEIVLSDCGVVYQNSHPYILCAMTKGKDLNKLNQALATISKTVWDEVNSYASAKK